MSKEKKIYVERETYEKNDNTYYTYFIKGKIRGRDVRIALAPPSDKDKKDMGGYTVLDIVFGDAMKAEFVVEPFEFKDGSGKTVTGARHLVRTVDESGEVYECAIKPARQSDKALLNMLLAQA
ncbi:MAG: hypothetical protein IKC36_05150 [Clostridia bacterium]|nr:hypothetical protein [Clostridia bacterium]